MKNFFDNKKLITLLVSFMIFIGVLWFSFTNYGSAPYFQQVTSDMTAVLGRAFSTPINAINRFFSNVNTLQDTFEENQRLKQEIDQIAEIQAEISTLKADNERLKEELDLQATLTDFTYLTGSVIARNPDMWIDQVIIDRGSSDGLEIGMSVMSNNGLAGRVTDVNPTSSKVTLLTTTDDTAVLTSAEIILEDETIFGVINGYDTNRNQLIMDQIIAESDIELGTDVVTSGMGGLVPRGLLVGTVAEVALDSHGLGQRVFIEPATNFKDIRYVTIINRQAESPSIIDEESEQDNSE
ncbi:MAG TPA: rod shape-determining protein MreC [Atopostipes sp.]|nr:rod shape-determining protein MreC [Atopostipes sp.]